MANKYLPILVTLVPLVAGCGSPLGFPTGKEISEAAEAELRVIDGDWRVVQTGAPPPTLRLDFTLKQQTNGQLQGSGTMSEPNAGDTIPITITGTFQRPTMVLTFGGMVYEGRAVSGAFRGDIVSIAGTLGSLKLTGEGYERTIPILLQK